MIAIDREGAYTVHQAKPADGRTSQYACVIYTDLDRTPVDLRYSLLRDLMLLVEPPICAGGAEARGPSRRRIAVCCVRNQVSSICQS